MNRLWLLCTVFFSLNGLAHTGTQLPVEYINAPVGLSADGETVIGSNQCDSGYSVCTAARELDYVWTAASGATTINYNFQPVLNLAANQTATAHAKVVSPTAEYIAGGYRITTNLGGGSSTLSYEQGFRWNQQTGFQALGLLPGYGGTNVQALSADGQVVVGYAGRSYPWFSDASQAIRWTPAEGLVSLGQPPGVLRSTATFVSADGSVVAGSMQLANDLRLTYRWTQATGMVGIGTLPGTFVYTSPSAMTPDGSVIVGTAQTTAMNGIVRAYRWDSATGMVDLDAPGNGINSIAVAVSADGKVVVGCSENSSGNCQAFRWTAEEGKVALGNLPGGTYSYATAVSADGSVIVGFGNAQRNCTNFICNGDTFVWTEATGMLGLRTLLIEHGYPASGWELEGQNLLAPDGKTVVVTARHLDCNSPYAGMYCEAYRSYIIHLDRVAVEIDFDIFTAANQVTPGAAGYVSVGVLGSNSATGDTSNFDATQVDPASLKLGTGEAPNVLNPFVLDINADGNADVAFGFATADTGIACEDTAVTLVGATYAGDAFSASDNIVTPECVDDGCHP